MLKVQSGRYKITPKRDRPLTYEMANPPHFIGHRKAWNSWNTCKLNVNLNIFKYSHFWCWILFLANLSEGIRPAQTTTEDIFIRRFMVGTWHSLVMSEVIIKRQFNHIRVAAIIRQGISSRKMYFLLGKKSNIYLNYSVNNFFWSF